MFSGQSERPAVFPHTGRRVEASQRCRCERGARILGGSRLKSRHEQFCSDLRSLVCYAPTNGKRNWGAADDSKAMTHLSRRERGTKAIAEVLARIADAYPELAPDRPDFDREAEEWLWDIASGYCAALDRYAARTMQVNRDHTGPAAQPSAHSDPRSAPGTHQKLGHNAAADSMLAFPSII